MTRSKPRAVLSLLLLLATVVVPPALASSGAFRHAFGVGMLRTQERGLLYLRRGVTEMTRLATRASDPALDVNARALLDSRFQMLLAGHDAVASNTEYEDLTLLDLPGTVTVQQDPDTHQFVDIHTADMLAATLGIDSLDLTTEVSATFAISDLQAALAAVEAEYLRNEMEQALLGL